MKLVNIIKFNIKLCAVINDENILKNLRFITIALFDWYVIWGEGLIYNLSY